MQENQVEQDLASIRQLMERSSKFISLSGLSGVLAGIYALIGAYFAHIIITDQFGYYQTDIKSGRDEAMSYPFDLLKLLLIAFVVLISAIVTGFILSLRKARRTNQKFWNASSKAVLFNMIVPLITGGIMILIFIWRGYFGIVAPAALIFYGLALVGAGNYTFKGVQYLGITKLY